MKWVETDILIDEAIKPKHCTLQGHNGAEPKVRALVINRMNGLRFKSDAT